MLIISAIVCAILVGGLLVAEYKDSTRGRWATKPLASLAFVVAGARALPLGESFGKLMLAGLLLAAAGDLLLIPKSQKVFRAGVLAFLFGHVAYAAAFVARGLAPGGAGLATPLVLAVTVPVARFLLPKVPAALKRAVVAYCVVISIMVILAAATFAARGGMWILAGAVAFYGSDLSVARDRFVSPGFDNRIWGLPLYYAAQMVLATGAAWP